MMEFVSVHLLILSVLLLEAFALSPLRSFLSPRTSLPTKWILSGGLNPWEFYASDGSFFNAALTRFDHANSLDPNVDIDDDGNQQPRELVYAQRLYRQVLNLNPKSSESLLLASRAQHIMRWKIPRDSYPMTKKGYLDWRASLKQFHANTAAAIMLEVGYDQPIIDDVKNLILKKNFPKDPDSQTLEDALCLVFLRYQLDEFAAKTEDSKTVNALKKSWAKMSESGRAEALKIKFTEKCGALVNQALTA
jgi:hypothetical protein